MRFLWPDLLWLQLLIPLLVALYLYVLARRKKTAIRYASLSLPKAAIGPGQRTTETPARRQNPPGFAFLGSSNPKLLTTTSMAGPRVSAAETTTIMPTETGIPMVWK